MRTAKLVMVSLPPELYRQADKRRKKKDARNQNCTVKRSNRRWFDRISSGAASRRDLGQRIPQGEGLRP